MSHVACRMLHVACCVLHVACCMSHDSCCMLRVACRVLHVACRMMHVVCCMLHACGYLPTCPCPCRSRSTTQKSWIGPRFATVSSTSMCEPFSSCDTDRMARHATQNMQHHTKHRTCDTQRTADRPALTLREGTLLAALQPWRTPIPGHRSRTGLSVYPRGARACAVLVVGRVRRVGRVSTLLVVFARGRLRRCRAHGAGMGWWAQHAVAYGLGFELQQLRVAECRPDEDDGRVEVPATVTRSCIM
jgi:hypothetical protein